MLVVATPIPSFIFSIHLLLIFFVLLAPVALFLPAGRVVSVPFRAPPVVFDFIPPVVSFPILIDFGVHAVLLQVPDGALDMIVANISYNLL